MDDYRAPSRPGQSGGSFWDAPVRSGTTQTPSVTNTFPSPEVAQGSAAIEQPAPGVNSSLLGGFSQPAPLQHQPVPVPIQQPAQAPIIPVSARFQSADQIGNLQSSAGMQRDFTMPRPQTIAQEVQVVSQSAEAAQAQNAGEQHASQPILPGYRPSPFDIATIEEQEKPKNRLIAGRAWRKWLLSGGIVMFCLLLGTGGLLFAQTYKNAHKVFRGTGQAAALTAGSNQTTLKGESTGRVNFLLLGNGGLGHEAPDLTDTIIVFSLDTVHKTATMLSIPRDLWVNIPGSSPTKINAAYEIGKYNEAGKIDNTNNNTKAVMAGFTEADQVVKSVTGITINYNVLVNFTSFKQAVDAVGGVTVNVPEQLYDPTMAWENGGNPVLAAAGNQVMDGTKALMYVRSRETSSDFARSQRQRSVILALKNKVLSAGTLSNPLKLSGLVNAFGDNMVTDMSLSEGMRAYSLGKGVDNTKIQTVDLVTPPNNLVTTSNINNVSIDIPRAGMFDYGAIQQYIQQLLNPPKAASAAASTAGSTVASSKPESAIITVLNGTTRAGLAGVQAAVIKGAGYNVPNVANAPSQAYTKTVIVDLSKGASPTTKKYLETTYGVTAVTQLPDAAIQPGSANFVVILGSDQVH
jgi:LCP family protein required for cell wall assembly